MTHSGYVTMGEPAGRRVLGIAVRQLPARRRHCAIDGPPVEAEATSR